VTPSPSAKPEVLPCPFCGAAPSRVYYSHNSMLPDEREWHREYHIECSTVGCIARGGAFSREPTEVVAAWNRRAPTPKETR
jgi:hypothetical protein